MGQLQFEVIPGDGRVCPEEPSGQEDLLEGAHRLDPEGCEALACAGEESEAALILAVQVHAAIPLAALSDQLRAVLREVFLKTSAAFGSLATCDFRAVLTCAPYLRFT